MSIIDTSEDGRVGSCHGASPSLRCRRRATPAHGKFGNRFRKIRRRRIASGSALARTQKLGHLGETSEPQCGHRHDHGHTLGVAERRVDRKRTSSPPKRWWSTPRRRPRSAPACPAWAAWAAWATTRSLTPDPTPRAGGSRPSRFLQCNQPAEHRIRFSGQPEEGVYAVRRYWRSIDGEPSCPIRSLHPGRLATVTVQIRADLTETAIHAPTETPMHPLDLLTLKASRVVVVDRRGLRFQRVEVKARRHTASPLVVRP
jgi:hypothetical protein